MEYKNRHRKIFHLEIFSEKRATKKRNSVGEKWMMMPYRVVRTWFESRECLDGRQNRGTTHHKYKMADGGHSFVKKTFHKPTYCHHCSDLLWGLIGQGCICEGGSLLHNCNFFIKIFFSHFDLIIKSIIMTPIIL